LSQRPFWISIIQWTLWALIMTAVTGWLGKARFKRTATGNDAVMTYPRAAMVMAFICVAGFGALVVLTLFASQKNAPWWTTAIFGFFFLASLHWLVDCFLARYSLSDEGLEYVSVFTGKRFFRWDELQSLRYAPNLRWFILRSSQGHEARISIMMTGLPEFARRLMERARKVDIAASAIPILQQTARGEPPSVWL